MMDKNKISTPIYLKDYQAPDFEIEHCTLEFSLQATRTIVTASYEIKSLSNAKPLVLDGEDLELVSIEIDQSTLAIEQYKIDEKALTIHEVPAGFNLKIITQINPSTNTSLNGLYQSGDMICTQCEAQGFRKITYGLDRPDVLTTYTVTITADKQRYPVLLSNGNQTAKGDLGADHFATWHDPFPKPTYLFALVAGNLTYHSDTFTTRSGRNVDLHVLTRPEDEGKTTHAMESLKRSMTWDEQSYDREYDLDIFHIVAVSDFNMGAMENKSLNIFNTKYVLARQEIATDQDYHAIEGVIGHEYFHNWSGNRVTCRDWFQLSLKEGFTVLRDQQFSGDMHSRGDQRIDDVNLLRTVQFKEDSGPMAHSVRPESYEEINNFYTVTIYEKGAEIVRMQRTLLGEAQFKQACNRYFDRYDGQAVTTDDFVQTMESSSGIDLKQFRLWYTQAGTPEVALSTKYDAENQTLTLDFSQNIPDTPNQANKEPMLIPIKTALFDLDGRRMRFEYEGIERDELTIHLKLSEQSVVLKSLESEPVPSVLREFSAPIKLDYPQSEQALSFLARHDDDPFNRWEAIQQLSLGEINKLLNEPKSNVSHNFIELLGGLLNDTKTDNSLLARLLTMPSESLISQQMQVIEPLKVHQARESLITQIAIAHARPLKQRYDNANASSSGTWTKIETGHRAIRDTCLAFLIRLENEDVYALATKQYKRALCMTDTIAALSCLTHSRYEHKQHYLDDFHENWQSEDLLVNKWLGLQSQDNSDQALANIENLCMHADFDEKNPNKVYALIGGFVYGNAVKFHAQDGSGYHFAASWILKLDQYNPQIAARMVGCFNQFKRYDTKSQAMMIEQMERIAAYDGLSDNVNEIINKALDLV